MAADKGDSNAEPTAACGVPENPAEEGYKRTYHHTKCLAPSLVI